MALKSAYVYQALVALADLPHLEITPVLTYTKAPIGRKNKLCGLWHALCSRLPCGTCGAVLTYTKTALEFIRNTNSFNYITFK